MESLFLTSAPGKEKTAAPSVTLSDDPAMWPKELISALLERAPYLGQYAIDQQTLGQDDRRGYAYGFFNVTAKGAPDLRPSDGAPNVPAAAPKGVTLRVPFIVQRRRMKPLHVFIDPASGKMYPLAQHRVDRLLYSPSTFAQANSGVGVGSSTLSGSGMYPDAPGDDMAGGSIGGRTKQASLCSLVGMTISPSRKEKIASMVMADPELLHFVESNASFKDHLLGFINAKSKEASAITDAIRKGLPTDAVLLEKTADGYRMQSACARAYTDDVMEIPFADQAAVPADLRKEADANGYAIRCRAPANPTDAPTPLKIKTAGAYMVQTSTSRVEPALVFTHVEDLDGNSRGGLLVKTASGHAYVDEAYGYPTDNVPSTLTDISWAELPRGEGFFIKTASAGSPVASSPVNLKFYEESDKTYAHYESGLEAGKIMISATLPENGAIKLASGLYGMHPNALVGFIPLGAKINLASTAGLAEKLASAHSYKKEVVITHSDGEYTLDGPPVEKLGHRTQFTTEPRAAFNLALVGVSPLLAKTKMAEARLHGRTTMLVPHTAELYTTQQTMAKVAAAKLMPHFPEKDFSLLKVAAKLQDDNTVDAVLGLNFITPENLTIFIEHIPLLENATNKLSELLIASQLGVSDIPESAVVRALSALEAITAGLELLHLRNRETLES